MALFLATVVSGTLYWLFYGMIYIQPAILLCCSFTRAQRSVPMIASDIMTRKVITIQPEASAQEAAQLLDQFRISGLPVVDARDGLIGIVTEADIISKVNRYGLLDQNGLRVADLMS